MSSKAKRWLYSPILCLFVLMGFMLILPTTNGQQSADPQLAARVQALLKQRCFQCHGQDGKAAKNVFVLDRARLIATQMLTPNDANSPLLKAIESGAMPLNGDELSSEEKVLVRRWILSGAPDWDNNAASATARAFISETTLLTHIREDLDRAPFRSRQFMRYVSLAHLYNAGVPDDELEAYRNGLAKLLNSLSWQREIALPFALDPARTVLRIDLRDYQWTAAQWRKVAAAYPYGLLVTDTDRITRLSGEAVPYLRADWFVAQASVPPLYHDLLGLPSSLAALEQRLGIDATRHFAEEKHVFRAGVRASGVSQNNRVLERHVSAFGAYWRSYDFKSNAGEQNIFANPLSLNPAGGEMIFNLPNGLQAYFLADGVGRRIDAAPVDIVADRNQPDDPVIRNGRSCMSCHFAGPKSFQDDVRPVLLKTNVARFDLDRALTLYAAQDEINRSLSEDETRFRQAELRAANKPAKNALTEPINALARRFEAELTLAQAAAEVGLETREFQERLRWNTKLNALGLGQLLTANSGIKRDVWERHFSETVRELGIGTTLSTTSFSSQRTWTNRTTAPSTLVAVAPISNDQTDLLRSAKTILITSGTVFLRPELLEAALLKRNEWPTLSLSVVKEMEAADLMIELNRSLFTFDFTYTVTHRISSQVLKSGKIVAFDGNQAAPKIAAELLQHIRAARAISAK